MKLILLGAPGAGKGTQSAIISAKLGIPSISTGDIIRSMLKSNSPQANVLRKYTDSGELVPDDIVVNLIKDRISFDDCKNGFILDGFPRTISQAESLEKMGIIIDKVINIEVDDSVVCARMGGRVVCPKCNAVFNTIADMRPKVSGKCDYCGSQLIKRNDDLGDTIKTRLKVYREKTLPLENYYTMKKILYNVDGSKSLDSTSSDILSLVDVKC